jgi:transposase
LTHFEAKEAALEGTKAEIIVRRYSYAFKQKVVSEIERGQLTLPDAERLYDIGGHGTITTWLKKLGKSHLLPRVVRIEMQDEVSKVKQQGKKIQALQAALSDAHLKILELEATLAVLGNKPEDKKKDSTKSSTT